MAASLARKHAAAHDSVHENQERWLLTYADMITLLLVFFIVLYTMSRTDTEKFKVLSAAFVRAFNTTVLSGPPPAMTPSDTSAGATLPLEDLMVAGNAAPQAARLRARLDAVVSARTAHDEEIPEVSVGTTREGVVVRLSGSFLFDSGRADLKPNALPILDALADELRMTTNDIRVDGHTDSIPLRSPRYASNWELSSARATAVTRYLVEIAGLRPERLAAAGFAEYRPVVPNDSREHRALNRRVEIRILSAQFAPPAGVAEGSRSSLPVSSTPRPLPGSQP